MNTLHQGTLAPTYGGKQLCSYQSSAFRISCLKYAPKAEFRWKRSWVSDSLIESWLVEEEMDKQARQSTTAWCHHNVLGSQVARSMRLMQIRNAFQYAVFGQKSELWVSTQQSAAPCVKTATQKCYFKLAKVSTNPNVAESCDFKIFEFSAHSPPAMIFFQSCMIRSGVSSSTNNSVTTNQNSDTYLRQSCRSRQFVNKRASRYPYWQ